MNTQPPQIMTGVGQQTSSKNYSSNYWTKKINDYSKKMSEARQKMSSAKMREATERSRKMVKKNVLTKTTTQMRATTNTNFRR